MFRIILWNLGLVLIAATAAVAQPPAGSIQGKVTDDQGQPVIGAYVVAAPTVAIGRVTLATRTSDSGAFTFSQVLPATYTLCVQVAQTAFIDQCAWSTPPRVTVNPGQASTNNNLQLARGSILHVRVNDPDQHLDKRDGVLLVGVRGPSARFRPLRQASRDASGKNFDIVIPFSTDVRLELLNRGLQIADDHGANLGAATSVAIRQPPGQPDRNLTFTITGKQ